MKRVKDMKDNNASQANAVDSACFRHSVERQTHTTLQHSSRQALQTEAQNDPESLINISFSMDS